MQRKSAVHSRQLNIPITFHISECYCANESAKDRRITFNTEVILRFNNYYCQGLDGSKILNKFTCNKL